MEQSENKTKEIFLAFSNPFANQIKVHKMSAEECQQK